MSKRPTGVQELDLAGDSVPPSAFKEKKRRPGRPPGSKNKPKEPDELTGTLTRASKLSRDQQRVIASQQADCRRLGQVVKDATPGQQDPRDIGALARATSILHELQRKAFDFGDQGAQVRAIIVVPATAGTMEGWQGTARKVLGKVMDVADPLPQRVIEADVLDEPASGSGDD